MSRLGAEMGKIAELPSLIKDERQALAVTESKFGGRRMKGRLKRSGEVAL